MRPQSEGRLRIVVDRNIPLIHETFGRLGEIIPVETGEFHPRIVRDADALIVRSETSVDAALLDGSKVGFVGTATIGTDHMDMEYLKKRDLRWASAPGCNANSVSEYIVAALLALARRQGGTLRGKTLGVVGVGNVGSKVARKAEALGMTVVLNDPPLARLTGEKKFLPLDDLMGADIVTLHVPLSTAGPDATVHFFNAERMARMKPGSVLINTSRGKVVDGKALAEKVGNGHLAGTIIDVWENEPFIDTVLLDRAFLGTPHIAGYSLDGKVNAVRMIYTALCTYAGADPAARPEPHLPPPAIDRIHVPAGASGGEELLRSIVNDCYDIARDDQRLRGIVAVPQPDRGTNFRQLRTHYPLRREFSATTVVLPREHAGLAATLRDLGFAVTHGEGKNR